MKHITIVIPVYNESASIRRTVPTILDTLDAIESVTFEILLVDDGSTDDTLEQIETLCNEHHRLMPIPLTRNFGKEAAMHAGLSHATGDAVIIMDSDLQHPPDLIPKMICLWQDGVDVVEAYKSSRGKESFLSRLAANQFYRIFNAMAGIDLANHSDFKLLDRKVVAAYLNLPERKRFMRGLVAWMGFASAKLPFEVPPRAHGATAWSRFKLMRFSITALTSFSSAPLHIVTGLGGICLVIAAVLGSIALYHKFTGVAVSGFTTVILLILIVGSLIMLGLGLIGIYLEQIFDEIKQRPIYPLDLPPCADLILGLTA